MRLDKALLAKGLVESRSRAHALIRDGKVRLNGKVVKKPSQNVADELVSISPDALKWVSRAALKLEYGLDLFGVEPTGCVALDVGASTGGFTEVLLARGATRVLALDVGRDQLHPKLRNDDRVINLEGVNARHISDDFLPELDLIVSDVSFISLSKALAKPIGFARAGAKLVALIKPQFEVGPALVGKGGIVRDESARQTARNDVREFLVSHRWRIIGEAESPIKGSDGNSEYLIAAQKL